MTRRRRLLGRVALGLALAAVLYVGSYFTLSRWSLDILFDYDNTGFWYVPVEPATMNRYPALKRLHLALEPIYEPLWTLDHRLNGFPAPDGVDYIDETRD